MPVTVAVDPRARMSTSWPAGVEGKDRQGRPAGLMSGSAPWGVFHGADRAVHAGVGNFAMHRAVSDSGHPMWRTPWTRNHWGAHFGLLTEYLMLLACMLMTAQGRRLGLGLRLYTMANGVAAWLILSRRI
jgi:hypothetical protein